VPARGAVTYDELVELAGRDENVLGLVLTGSRATGLGLVDGSDWDVRLVVRDGIRDDYRSRLATPHGPKVEVVVLGEADLELAGEIGTSSAWDRYSWVHARVVVDRGGWTAGLVDRKRTLKAEDAMALAAEHLDDYVNWLYRSLKNADVGLDEGARLDAAESTSSLLDFLFAVNGRVRPFNRQLRWELEVHPLPGKEWSSAALLPRIVEILDTASIEVQRKMFRDVESLARSHRLGDVVDSWEPDVVWLRGER
jgi:hypothetical protein